MKVDLPAWRELTLAVLDGDVTKDEAVLSASDSVNVVVVESKRSRKGEGSESSEEEESGAHCVKVGKEYTRSLKE